MGPPPTRPVKFVDTTDGGLHAMDVVFDLPFLRPDLWAELMNTEKPLGVAVGTRLSILQPGNDKDVPLSMGAVRETVQSSNTKYVCSVVDYKHDLDMSSIVWEIIEQLNTSLVLHGISDRLPRTVMSLEDDLLGTRVTLRYTFSRLTGESTFGPGCSGCCNGASSAELKAALAHVCDQWHDDMARRGYRPLRPPDARLGDGFVLSFDLPYRREDVYAELVSTDHPLGVGTDVQLKHSEAEGSEGAASQRGQLRVNVTRTAKVSFEDGGGGEYTTVVDTLIENAFLKFRQVKAESSHLRLLGDDASATQPEITITLGDKPSGSGGTCVRLAYAFKAAESRHWLGCLLPCAYGARALTSRMQASMEHTLPTFWASSMAQRGYAPTKAPVERSLPPLRVNQGGAPQDEAQKQLQPPAEDAATAGSSPSSKTSSKTVLRDLMVGERSRRLRQSFAEKSRAATRSASGMLSQAVHASSGAKQMLSRKHP
jgi:hypothetical protein